jgi:hypothetical protein
LVGNHLILALWKGISTSPINAMHGGYGVGAVISVLMAANFIKFNPIEMRAEAERFIEQQSTTNYSTLNSTTTITTTLKDHITKEDITIQTPYTLAAGVSLLVSCLFILAQILEKNNDTNYEKSCNNEQTAKELDQLNSSNDHKTGNSKVNFLDKLIFGKRSNNKKMLNYTLTQILMLTLMFIFISGFQNTVSKLLLTYVTLGPAKFSVKQFSILQIVFWLSYVIGRFNAAFLAFRMNVNWFMLIVLIGNALNHFLLLIPALASTQTFVWISISLMGFFVGPIQPSGFMIAKRVIGDFNSFVLSIFLIGNGIGGLLFQQLTGDLLDMIKPSDNHRFGYEQSTSAYFIMHILLIPSFAILITFLSIWFIYRRYKSLLLSSTTTQSSDLK